MPRKEQSPMRGPDEEEEFNRKTIFCPPIMKKIL
jgi:hypothetical protein